LTAALLKEDFGLTWWLPDGHLCPTLTSRCNYLLWVEDLITLMPPHDGGTAIRGVDIGTGASAIYALLGAAAHGWSFVATDVTDEGLHWARRNVDANPHVKGLIEVRRALQAGMLVSRLTASCHLLQVRDARVDASDQASWPLLAGVLKEGESFAFTVSNPPFFESLSEAGQNPGTACGGTASEMIYPGGEAAFIAAHMTDSQLPHIRSAVSWFTTLCGKKATLRTMVDALRAARAPAVRTACFRQGKTTRWGLAWSWMADAGATQSTPLPVAPPPTKTHTATPAATLPRPCTRASFQLRFSAKDVGAPVAILAALHAALATHSSVRSCTCDTASFTVAGVLNCSSDMDDGQRAAKKRHIDGDSGRAAPFSAAVQRSSQCSVTVTIQLLAGPSRQSGPAQVALAQIARAVESTLTAQWRAE
jgi:23S rRNA (adenine1618-N6)-methyltransferase